MKIYAEFRNYFMISLSYQYSFHAKFIIIIITTIRHTQTFAKKALNCWLEEY